MAPPFPPRLRQFVNVCDDSVDGMRLDVSSNIAPLPIVLFTFSNVHDERDILLAVVYPLGNKAFCDITMFLNVVDEMVSVPDEP